MPRDEATKYVTIQSGGWGYNLSPPTCQKAVQDNRRAREEEALREKRLREREELTKRRSQKMASKFLPERRRGSKGAEPSSTAPPQVPTRERHISEGRDEQGWSEEAHLQQLMSDLELEFDTETQF